MGDRPLRTAHAADLGAAAAGNEVRLAGWVAHRRDHGGVIFLDLRDASGVVQVVIDPEENPEAAAVAKDVRSEFCISVNGAVRARLEGTVNPDMATGEIEVLVAELLVLSPAEPLPFQIDDRTDVDELKRLEFRYLDLRRPRMAANLRARSAAISAMRRSMDDMGFLEVETPTLIRSTPEGARDLLVPSRLRQGSFYALPQSPQLFKQLLMISGVERYYQIARCYRDEDFRADRQVEFTQLDVEGAFWDRDDVLDAIEEAVVAATEAVRGEAPSRPFPRMSYADAMARFGTDKPDLRFGMEIVDLSTAFAATEFKAFAATLEAGGVVRGINAGRQAPARSALDALVGRAQELGAKGLVWLVVEEDGSLRSPVAKFLGATEQDAIKDALEAGSGDLLLLVADQPKIAAAVLGQFRLDFGRPEGHGELNFTWVVDFPVFEEAAEGDLVAAHHPFTAPVDVEELVTDPINAVAKAYDLVLNGSELGSGSVRIHDPEVQAKVFSVLGISYELAERRFGWFLRALGFGTPPHAGFAVGLDRLISILQEEENIREVMPFPKTQTGVDPMTGSPTLVEDHQLAELGIDLRPEVREAVAEGEEES
jgi:aspartyl-tRNA synthetase